MSIRTRIATLVVALIALAAVPAVASAGTEPMRGVVSGSPYGASGGQMAVPVLFSKMTARNAGLKSPVGVIIVKRTTKVKLPNGGGYTVPVNLRTGDRFKGFGQVGDLQRRVFYPRVVFSKPVVYFRSKELSLSELSAAIEALRKALGDLQNQVTQLKNFTLAGFNALLGEIDALKKQLAALNIPAAVDLSGLQSQIDDLKGQLNGVIDSLKDYAKLTDVDKKIADAIAGLNLLTTGDVTNTVNSILDTLNFDTTALTTFIDDTVNNLLGDPTGTLTTAVNGLIDDKITADVPGLVTNGIDAADLASQADLDTANAQIDALTQRLDALCQALDVPAITTALAPGVATACN